MNLLKLWKLSFQIFIYKLGSFLKQKKRNPNPDVIIFYKNEGKFGFIIFLLPTYLFFDFLCKMCISKQNTCRYKLEFDPISALKIFVCLNWSCDRHLFFFCFCFKISLFVRFSMPTVSSTTAFTFSTSTAWQEAFRRTRPL